MLSRLTFSQCFLLGGAVLGVLGLILFWTLPIKQGIPPFLLTALLATGYGVYDLVRVHHP